MEGARRRDIGSIPLRGDASCAAEQSESGRPPRPPVCSAVIAQVGVAAGVAGPLPESRLLPFQGGWSVRSTAGIVSSTNSVLPQATVNDRQTTTSLTLWLRSGVTPNAPLV